MVCAYFVPKHSMKLKTFEFLWILLALLSITSCNGVEGEAKKQMEKSMKELALNPETIKIDEVKTKYVSDSVCVLYVRSHGQNRFGGWANSKEEYLYCLINDEDEGIIKYEAFIDLKKKPSVLDTAEKTLQENNGLNDALQKGQNKSGLDPKSSLIELFAKCTAMLSGRKIED